RASIGPWLRDLWVGGLVLWYASVGRNAEARTLGESFRSDTAIPPNSMRTFGVRDSQALLHLGLAFAYEMTGMPDVARKMFARAKASTDNDILLVVIRKWELHSMCFHYAADDLVERRRAADETAAAMGRANGVQADLGPRVAYLPVLALEGG